MKIKGQPIPGPSPVTVKFFRGEQVVELQMQAVLSYEQFDRFVPLPKPPLVTNIKEKRQYHNYDDPSYTRAIQRYSELKSNYILIKGLEATDGLEWSTVKIDEPDTWANYKNDLLSCFTEAEVASIIEAANEANYPTARRLQEAFDSFTPSQDQPKEEPAQSSQADVPAGTASGEPVKDSV